MILKCAIPEALQGLCDKLAPQLGDAFSEFKNTNHDEGTVELVLNPSASKYAHDVITCSGFVVC